MKTETKHTAGKWTVGESGTIYGEREESIGIVYADTPQHLANEKLIASAPDLLAALEGVLRVADRATDEFDAARAAIRKAKGEA